ncbi:DUF6266 family protein [Plebeiibacterium sediminum]|uniref:DUF6266 family protein n=1 Tax=Plebeiibacterium sediminum TaxID=2992112 RepID=A0AAE3SE83_9BACT|nr:DUF6266 family protein [Plebeiobacterium sediminum]MCW3786135.1 DUF6266 family protein [Plebeiobacterium sediminum]
MGKIDKGILGGFSGKVGNVIGSTWKGISYMKSKPASNNKKASEKQIIHRARFMYAAKFLQRLQPVIEVGYRMHDRCKTARNEAMSEFLNYTLTGDYPMFKVNYNRLRLAKGSLELPADYSVALVDNRALIKWSVDSNSEDDQSEDKLLAQLLENNVLLVSIADGCEPKYTMRKFKRKDGSGDIGLPNAPSGTEVHCYLAFIANDDSMRVSNSIYVGSVIAP